MAFDFKPRAMYSFDVYPTAVLGTGFKRVTVQAVLDYDTALGFYDVEALQRNVYSFLPQGTPDRPQDYDYLKLVTEDNIQTIIAVPWINEDTIVLVQSLKAQVVIEDLTSAADIERIRACLSQNGFNKIDIKLIDG